MVSEVIEASPLGTVSKRIYAKGSYANNTNVRRDSDVDIAVDCYDCMFYESHETVAPPVVVAPYEGPWSAGAWRQAVTPALGDKFAPDVDASGSVALHIRIQRSRASSRARLAHRIGPLPAEPGWGWVLARQPDC